MIPFPKTTAVGFAALALLASPALAQGGGGKIVAYINSLPKQAVDANEVADLKLMREEEKLARDVYSALYQIWAIKAFQNIAKAEQSHMDLVKVILDRYSIPDPIKSDKLGVFPSPVFTGLFNVMVSFGAASRLHAEFVGAFIEDLDIFDLDRALRVSDNRDIDTVWQNLQLGSRNHMRSFDKLLKAQSVVYPGIVLPFSRVQAIVNSPHEKGAVDENGKRLR